MSAAQSLVDSGSSKPEERAELCQIDESTRIPVLIFIGSAVAWLFVGTIFALMAWFKMHTPEFLADCEWLTFGRVRPAYINILIYGWATNSAIAVAFWLMARLSRTPLHHAGVLYISGALWNFGVLLGTAGVLGGDSQAIEWLEFPPYATPILLVSYALIGVWALVTFRFRASKHAYVSQWYIVAAMFWFPWIYSVAQIMLVFSPSIGVTQAITNGWFIQNLIGLWFTPIAFAAIYYFIPKVLGKPIHSYNLAILGFWTLALFASWSGAIQLIGGPVPVWVQTISIVASFMMLIPVITTAINFHATVLGSFGAVWASPTLRFVVFGAVNYTLVSLVSMVISLRSVNEVIHFTHFSDGHTFHLLYAFFSMVMFGSIYFILPRILHKEWPSSFLINIHFWCSAGGIVVYVLALSIGGAVQGMQLQDFDGYPDFIQIVQDTVPWLFTRTMSGILMLFGHVAFTISFVLMLLKPRTGDETTPTLFNNPPALELKTS